MYAAVTPDPVRTNTAFEVNQRIDRQIEENVRYFSGRPASEILRRIEELGREWDIERVLEANASAVALAGLAASTTISRKLLIIPALVAGFLLQHAIQGWCPPVPVLRRMGVRTADEIGRERHALRILRGDFEGIPKDSRRAAAEKAIEGTPAGR